MNPLAEIVVERLFGGDVVEHLRLRRVEVRIESVFKGANLLDLQIVEEALGSGEKNDDLLLGAQRMELRLLQQLGEARTAVELVLRHLVQVAAELREGGQLAILREVELERGADLLDGLDRGGESDARDGEADVDRRDERRS